MILPDTKILWRANEFSLFNGMDSPGHCLDISHFQNYPYTVDYRYNSRGFRDREWPTTCQELQNIIWCVGDSFTAGVGLAFEHTWAQMLHGISGKAIINISLDGSSNNWISRHIDNIINAVKPKIIIAHWTYSHRREHALSTVLDPVWCQYYNMIRDPSWPDCDSFDMVKHLDLKIQQEITQDERFQHWQSDIDTESQRRLRCIDSNYEDDIINTQNCIDFVSNRSCTTILHSFVPRWHAVRPILNFHGAPEIEYDVYDLGRDGYHYGVQTARKFAEKLVAYL